jgi:hypothetical protein
VTANAYSLPTKRRTIDTFISSENAPKLTYSNLGAKKFPGVNTRTPNNGNRKRGWEKGKVAGEGVGNGVRRKGVGKGKCFSPKFVGHAPPMPKTPKYDQRPFGSSYSSRFIIFH